MKVGIIMLVTQQNYAYIVRGRFKGKPILGVYKTRGLAQQAIKQYLLTLNFVINNGRFINKTGEAQNAKYLDQIQVDFSKLSETQKHDFEFDTTYETTLNRNKFLANNVVMTTNKYNYILYRDGFMVKNVIAPDNFEGDFIKELMKKNHLVEDYTKLGKKQRSYKKLNYKCNLGPLFKMVNVYY